MQQGNAWVWGTWGRRGQGEPGPSPGLGLRRERGLLLTLYDLGQVTQLYASVSLSVNAFHPLCSRLSYPVLSQYLAICPEKTQLRKQGSKLQTRSGQAPLLAVPHRSPVHAPQVLKNKPTAS